MNEVRILIVGETICKCKF